jgi:hypothetical protein
MLSPPHTTHFRQTPKLIKVGHFPPISHLFLGAPNRILRHFIFGAYLVRNTYEISVCQVLGVYDSHGFFHAFWVVTLRRLVSRRIIIVKYITILRYVGA